MMKILAFILILQTKNYFLIFFPWQIEVALSGIYEIYEQILNKKCSARCEKIVYTLSDVLEFVDKLHEVMLLIYDKGSKTFQPHGKTWLKALILNQTYNSH